MDIRAYNRAAWDREVEQGNRWTQPVSPEVIAAARQGDWGVWLTDNTMVPREWFPLIQGCDVLCLASGGGQQAPTLAAAGANVTVLDNSPRQLAQDRMVAEREGLTLHTLEGDMADLSAFDEASFDLVFHPVSNLFVPDVRPVWKEAYRVLRPGGILMAGFLNPIIYAFDRVLADQGTFHVRFPLPYSDLQLSGDERRELYGDESALEFSHSLTDQIGGQLTAGFLLTGFYEDYQRGEPIADYMPSYIATRAIKPA
jgi:SAM-dependent methyltransferase